MELRNATSVSGNRSGEAARPCPRCRAPMEDFDGPDVRDRNYRGLLCPKCHWFSGVRSLGYGRKRVGPRADGRYEEPYEGRIRPR